MFWKLDEQKITIELKSNRNFLTLLCSNCITITFNRNIKIKSYISKCAGAYKALSNLIFVQVCFKGNCRLSFITSLTVNNALNLSKCDVQRGISLHNCDCSLSETCTLVSVASSPFTTQCQATLLFAKRRDDYMKQTRTYTPPLLAF